MAAMTQVVRQRRSPLRNIEHDGGECGDADRRRSPNSRRHVSQSFNLRTNCHDLTDVRRRNHSWPSRPISAANRTGVSYLATRASTCDSVR